MNLRLRILFLQFIFWKMDWLTMWVITSSPEFFIYEYFFLVFSLLLSSCLFFWYYNSCHLIPVMIVTKQLTNKKVKKSNEFLGIFWTPSLFSWVNNYTNQNFVALRKKFYLKYFYIKVIYVTRYNKIYYFLVIPF